MTFFVYTQQNETSIESCLGFVDYSYFFVMQKFLPVLRRLGRTVIVSDVAGTEVLAEERLVPDKRDVLFCFAPPHRAPVGLRCPVVMVFAWEYSSIPDEPWGNDARQNWVAILKELKSAITHSAFAVAAVQQSLGKTYPIVSLPAPVWNDYAKLCRSRRRTIDMHRWELTVKNGVVLDSHLHGSNNTHLAPAPSFVPLEHRLTLEGVIYTTVFNPADGRKNWGDLMSAFCFAFRDNPDVTLIMKLVCSDVNLACSVVWHEMKKLSPYRCRMVAVQGYVDEKTYRTLVANSTFIVNSSYGEGQCLPLMEFMSAGKPAVAPDHTAMADYIDTDNAFIVRSSEEWTHWPHDPRLVLRAFRYRIDWESLRDAFCESYKVVSEQPKKYLQMSKCATQRLREHCSQTVIEDGLSGFLQELGCLRHNRRSLLAFIRVHWFMRWRRLCRYAVRKIVLYKERR
jgi:glycosyltransferase involved in cell wall biosynthesis